MITAIIAILAAGALAGIAGWLVTRRAGQVQDIEPGATSDARLDRAQFGLSHTGPTIVHFSAAWCGQCTRVRRAVEQLCDELREVAHVEVDLDSDPGAAQRYSVLSLPTTLIFDAQGQQRYRATGVPKAADLRSALTPLLA